MMVEVRCKKCNGKLGDFDIVRGEIKCRKCGYINKFETFLSVKVRTDPKNQKIK